MSSQAQARPRVAQEYISKVMPALVKELGSPNVMTVPKIVKVTINCGAGKAAQDKKLMQQVQKELSLIAGQHAVITYARKSEASFGIREGWPIGCMVTLRGARMYQFLDRLLTVALPRIRDFRGLNSKSFDGRGNYSFGVKEQIIFPEIEFDKIEKIMGMDITVVTTAASNEQALMLLKAMGFPFRDQQEGKR